MATLLARSDAEFAYLSAGANFVHPDVRDVASAIAWEREHGGAA